MITSNETEGIHVDRGTTVRSRGARTQKEPRAPTDDDAGPNAIYTVEPVNVDMLRDVASRRGAEVFRMQGCSLRECIYYFLRCVEKDYGRGVGSIVGCWRESSTLAEFGIKTRRFSGCGPFLDQDSNGGPMDRMRRLVKEGVLVAFVGKSLFGMPKLLRYIGRTGLDACDIDQVNAHFHAQSKRHPEAEVLTQYIKERATT